MSLPAGGAVTANSITTRNVTHAPHKTEAMSQAKVLCPVTLKMNQIAHPHLKNALVKVLCIVMESMVDTRPNKAQSPVEPHGQTSLGMNLSLCFRTGLHAKNK